VRLLACGVSSPVRARVNLNAALTASAAARQRHARRVSLEKQARARSGSPNDPGAQDVPSLHLTRVRFARPEHVTDLGKGHIPARGSLDRRRTAQRHACDDAAGLREHQLSSPAGEELFAEHLLEPMDLAADGGVRQAELLARSNDASFLRDDPEVEEMVIVEPWRCRSSARATERETRSAA